MNCSIPGFCVLHCLPEVAQIHVYWVSDAIQPSHSLSPPSPPSLSFPASGSFPKSQLLASGGHSIGASASASVLPVNIQGWTCTAAAAAKSLQSCPTLCDPIDGGPPGSPVPGILQARTREWVAISFSDAWKWKVKGKSLSLVRLSATPWSAAYQAPPSMGFSRQEYWSGVPLPSPWTCTHMFISISDLCKLAIPHSVTRWRLAGVRKMYKETEHQDKRPMSFVLTKSSSATPGNSLKEFLWLSAIQPPLWSLPEYLSQKQ